VTPVQPAILHRRMQRIGPVGVKTYTSHNVLAVNIGYGLVKHYMHTRVLW